MDSILESIPDLLDVVDEAVPGTRALARPGRPAWMLLADAQGRLLSLEEFHLAVDREAATRLAADLPARLKGTSTWRAPAPKALGSGRIVAARLKGLADERLLACGFTDPIPEGHGCDVLLAAVAEGIVKRGRDEATLRTRIDHLLAEHETLRASHSLAIAAVIEEREGRIRAEQEHASQLRALMMAAADGIVTVDETGRIESFNATAAEIFGYGPSEMIGRSISILMPVPYHLWWHDGGGTGIADGDARRTTLRREVPGCRKDGSMFPMDVSVSEVSLGSRRLFIGIFRDITERKQAEEELRRLHMQNEMILNSAGEGIMGVDRQGTMIFVNPAAARMLGWDVAALVGRSMHETVHQTLCDGSASPPGECPVCRTLEGDGRSTSGDEVFWRQDGTSFPVEYTGKPIHEGGQLVGAVITFRDITEKRTLETQLRQAQKLESIGQLAAGIAHEINTPTQYIGDNVRFLDDAFRDLIHVLSACRALREGEARGPEGPAPACRSPEGLARVFAAMDEADLEYLVEEIPAAIAQSLDGVRRVSKIVLSMKEFSHPGGHEMQAVDLNKALESTLTVSRNEWKYVAEVATDLAPDLPLVTCIPGDCNQVFLNLIVNAAHAIAEKSQRGEGEMGRITVATRRENDGVIVSVADTGAGIPWAVRSRIFDPFFTTKSVGRGTGQGLAIAHTIITERHGGAIGFESELGRGTTFTVRLPIQPNPAPRATRE